MRIAIVPAMAARITVSEMPEVVQEGE